MSFPSFASGEVLTAADMNAVGMWLVKTQTIGSGVASVSISNAFSANYDNYRIIINDVTASTSGNLYFQFQDSSGNNITTAFYAASGFYQLASTTLNGSWGTTGTFWETMPMSTGSTNHCGFDLLAPNLAKFTRANGFGGMAEAVSFMYSGLHRVATAYPAFRIYPGSGTITGGTIRVYGYRN
jgi:hypothetical protein